MVITMEVILAQHLGFCYGVKRAIKLARDSASPDVCTCTLGPIIHNPQMVEKLASEGVGMVQTLEEMREGTIIIRSHGVGPQVYRQAEKTGLFMVDATCPHVKKAQLSAQALAEEGYEVILVGEKKHPEVKSIFEWSGHKATVVESVEEARGIQSCARLGIVVQTTFSTEKFKEIALALMDKANDIKIARTICTATDQRQAAAMELASTVDLMLVIGGKNSANTTRLAQLCSEKCPTRHIETVAELADAWFENVEKVGITAGASTPDWIIREVYKKVQDMESLLQEESMREIKEHDIIKGTVVLVTRDEAFVDIGYKAEVAIPRSELAYPAPAAATDVVKNGDELQVYVVSMGGENGMILSKVKADKMAAWSSISALVERKETVNAQVTEAVKGGLVVSVMGVRAFVPASQMELHFVKDLSVYVGQTFEFLPIELDMRKQRLVLSRRVLLEAEREKKQAEIFESLSVNQVLHGTVKRLADYGAFIDIGGMDGLAHISDLSWERVKHPSEVLQIGEEVEVMVKSFDPVSKRISLSVKDTMRDPWQEKADRYEAGMCVKGKIVKLADFGAFMEIEPKFDGLIHIGELSEKRISKAEEIVKVGDEVTVKILQLDRTAKRIALSLTKAQQDKEKAEYDQYMAGQDEKAATVGEEIGDVLGKMQ